MPAPDSAIAFALLSLALIVVPGPSVMFVVSRGVALGRRAALLTVAGNAAGVYVRVLLVGVGRGAAVERSVVIFTAVKLLGAAYLVWLGVQAIWHRRSVPAMFAVTGAARPRRSVFVDGLVVVAGGPQTVGAARRALRLDPVEELLAVPDS